MKKFLSIMLIAMIALFAFTGCGKKETAKEIDITKLCQDLQGTITSEVKEVNSDILASTFFIDMEQVEESIAALNSGANAAEIVVLKCKDSKYPADAEGLFKQRMADRSKLFADYNAPEAEKCDNALLKKTGNYIVFCITDDNDAADKILKEAGF